MQRALWMAIFLLNGVSASADDVATPAIQLKEFGHVEVAATGILKGQDTKLGVDHFAQQIENILRSDVNAWDTKKVLTGKRTLRIEPDIMRFELKSGSTFPRNAEVLLHVLFLDPTTGEIVADPTFSATSSVINLAQTRTQADGKMLTDVARQASDYLQRTYQAAVAEQFRGRN